PTAPPAPLPASSTMLPPPRVKRRPSIGLSIAALRESLVESTSSTFGSVVSIDAGRRTPHWRGSTEPASPIERAPLELEVEGGDPFARAPSTEAVNEMWRRSGAGENGDLSGSLMRALEDVMEGKDGRESGESYRTRSDDVEEMDEGVFGERRDESSKFTEEFEEDDDDCRQHPQTPSPPQMQVVIIAATPSSTSATSSSLPNSPPVARVRVPSNVHDPFPAPSYPLSSTPPHPIHIPSRSHTFPNPLDSASRPPLRAYSSTPPHSSHTPPPRLNRANTFSGTIWGSGSSAPSFALRRMMRGREKKRGSSTSTQSDESFSCIGEGRRGLHYPHIDEFGRESDEEIERLESSRGPTPQSLHERRESEGSSSGLKALQLPSLLEEEGAWSSPSSSSGGYRRKEKRSWWKSSSTTSGSRPSTPASPTPWNGIPIRHSNSFPALRRPDGLPASNDWSGARSDTRMSAPTQYQSKLFGSPIGASRTSTPRPVGSGRKSSEESSASSLPHSSSDSNHRSTSSRHQYQKVEQSTSYRRPSPFNLKSSRIPRPVVATHHPIATDSSSQHTPSPTPSSPDDIFDQILNWDLPLFPEADGTIHSTYSPDDDADHHFGYHLRRDQNYSSTSTGSALSKRDTIASGGSDQPLVSHRRRNTASTLEESTPPPNSSYQRFRVPSHVAAPIVGRRVSLDSTRIFARDALASLDSPTVASSSSGLSPAGSDFGWRTKSPGSDTTGFFSSPGSEAPLSPLKEKWGPTGEEEELSA
ncbi:hypothetical protein P7C70_g5620, partial [Phenoliferia sp. Uapishka_3]